MMMARAKRVYILIVKVNKLFSVFSSRCFLKEIENMFFVFLSSYRNTRESLGALEKAVETLIVYVIPVRNVAPKRKARPDTAIGVNSHRYDVL